MRGAPQVRFSATMRKIRSRTSLETLLLPSRLLNLRDQGPIQTEAGSMPANHGLRGNHDERLLPGRPTPASQHPEQFVEHAELGFRMLALQHGELLPECQILQEQASARTKDANKYSEP